MRITLVSVVLVLATVVGCVAEVGAPDDSDTETLAAGSSINWKINGYTLSDDEKQWITAFASRVVPQMAIHYGSTAKALDEATKAAWWSLKEGVMHYPAWPPAYSNCNYTSGDKHVGPFTVCPSGRAWQVGLAGVQVHYNSLATFENAAKKCYPGKSYADILRITAEEAQVSVANVQASTGDLRKSWLARNSCVGSVVTASVVQKECIDSSKSWCASSAWYPSNRYAPTLSGARTVRAQLKALLVALYEADIDFIDVLPGHTFFGSIKWAKANGITQGCGAGGLLYCPGSAVTRGEMATFLARALPLPASTVDYFIDDASSVHEPSINKIRKAGITMGCNPPTNTLFCPDRSIYRGELATFLTRALELPAADADYFTDDEASPYENGINSIAAAGISLGCNPPANTLFCPTETVSRGQMAVFLHRALN